MNDNLEPRLAPPGAGLPKVELLIARWVSRWRRWTGNREAFNADFQRERTAIQRLYRSCGPQEASRHVLIKRPVGLEDSSRYWSVWMTLDHLRIVNRAIASSITNLAKGLVPQGAASTARVKPSPTVTAEVVREYEDSCDFLLLASAAAPDLKTKVRYAHPWFGPLDAWGWHALAGGHMGIHRVQFQRILQGIVVQRQQRTE